jgi:hypothetical protein
MLFTLVIGQYISKVESFESASKAYVAAIGRRTMHSMPTGRIHFDGVEIAHVSYNGKVWPGTEWRSGLRPLFDPSAV